MLFAYYPNKESYTPQNYLVWELSELITSPNTKQVAEDYKAGKITKEELPIILPSASMKAGVKEGYNIIEHSSLIWLDIDTKKNPNINIDELQARLKKDKYTYYTWHSINGGLRIVADTDCTLESHSDYWKDIKYYYEHTYDIIADPKPSAPNSFCFLSYDPNPYCNVWVERWKSIRYKHLWEKRDRNGYCKNRNIPTSVPFSGYTYLNYSTPVDESLFEDKQQPIYINGGVDFCEIRLYKDLEIPEGRRNNTIANFCMILLYNNPKVELPRLQKELHRINKKHCKPKMKAKDVHSICKANYKRHKAGELNFSTILTKKYVFYSKEFKGVQLTEEQLYELEQQSVTNNELKFKMLRENKHKLSMQCLKYGKQSEYEQRIYEAIEQLRDTIKGKVTYKQIANQLGVNEKTIKRRMTAELKAYCKP